ncbi:MAG: serine kinase [Candidatus Cloacimonadota bacterium]|nr:serine kinase [Candidatus Cloacimonadota bacterium]
MNLKDIVEKLGLEVVSGDIDREVSGGYSSDLLSDVIANAQEKNIWITLQIHINIVAVANLQELACIILINGRQPEEATLIKAKKENIPILLTDLSTFEIVGKLYEMGIRGNKG